MSKRCRRRFLQVARTHFDSLILQIAQRVQEKLPDVDKYAHQELSKKLTTSLVDGETVLFEDPGALGEYTLKRLRPRCRALLEVLLAENCTSFFETLIKRVETACEEDRDLCVASLGGGPGFDAIALLASLAAVKEASQQEPSATNATSQNCELGCRCKIFDLAPAWSSALSAVSEAAVEIFPWQKELIQLIAPVDLRDSTNPELLEDVGKADMIIAAYVLHENEAFLLEGGILGGILPEVFKAAPIGIPMIFLDATHRLWPALVATARKSVAPPTTFRVLLPQGLVSHIHAVVLIKEDEKTDSKNQPLETQLFDHFTSHQRANEMRLQRLNEAATKSVASLASLERMHLL